MPTLLEITHDSYNHIPEIKDNRFLSKELLRRYITNAVTPTLDRYYFYPDREMKMDVFIDNHTDEITDFVSIHGLDKYGKDLIRASTNAQEHILYNCTYVSIESSYLGFIRGKTIKPTYHEPNNEAEDISNKIQNYILIGVGTFTAGYLPGWSGALAGLTAFFTQSTTINTQTQGFIWGTGALIAGLSAYNLARYFRGRPRYMRRNREFLGIEDIVEREIELTSIGKRFNANYNNDLPAPGRYSGLAAKYSLGEPKSRIPINLMDWHAGNNGIPLFSVGLSDTTPMHVAHSVIFSLTVDGIHYEMHFLRTNKNVKAVLDAKEGGEEETVVSQPRFLAHNYRLKSKTEVGRIDFRFEERKRKRILLT